MSTTTTITATRFSSHSKSRSIASCRASRFSGTAPEPEFLRQLTGSYAPPCDDAKEDNGDIAIVLALIGIVLGLASIGLSVLRRRSDRGVGRPGG